MINVYRLASELATSLLKSPSREADRRPEGQEIPRLVWDLKIHYRVQKSQLLKHILI
jgi:hypothetical protein